MRYGPKYYLWNIGCQMNKAESEQLASHAEELGYAAAGSPAEADLVLMNTCVVRGSAEEKVIGQLTSLKGLKDLHPGMRIAVTGCFVDAAAEKRFPYVDLFFPSGDFDSFRQWLSNIAPKSTAPPRTAARPAGVVANVPVIRGCNNFCSYCIVPYRRGREQSRTPDEILGQIAALVEGGVREVTLLGQNVNSYGKDLGDSLDGLLAQVNNIQGLSRIRFLTSHPRDVDESFVAAMSSLGKVCQWISLPVQAGSNRVLAAMRRGYDIDYYRKLVSAARLLIPGIAISTDVIVGFPGEGESDFLCTVDLLSELRFDTVHVAAYSPRPGTLAARTMPDNVPALEKRRRLQAVEQMQEKIRAEQNQEIVGKLVEVLVERRHKGKWEGRTRTNRLVFIESPEGLAGQLVTPRIISAGAWSLQGEMVPEVVRT
ncbi:MAG: tRNA (N6-isopentenyl adenosine(37)-C2)-methylthiotransferase MiaB [Chloroflexi bacterium]|nr:tRNA (N6-isopentenyl adenosine(37)-C2)-methylthiotransferase MiaB [Chloroflexota bacterium]